MYFINGYVGRCKYKANRGRLQCTYSELLGVAESNLPNATSKMATQAKSHGMENHTDMPPGTDCPYPIRILAFLR